MAKIKITTPKGELSWVFIDGEGSLNDLNDKYEYKATLTLEDTSPDCIALKKKYDDLWDTCAEKKAFDTAFESAKPAVQAKMEFHKGYSPVLDDDEQETGKTQFRFKTSTTYAPKAGQEVGKAVKVTVYNAKAKKVELGDTKIGNESIGKIAGTIASYYKATNAGVSGYLSSIQLIKLVEYVDNEFEEEEGFTGEPDNEFTGNEATSDPEPSPELPESTEPTPEGL